jgi:hypothetical protein
MAEYSKVRKLSSLLRVGHYQAYQTLHEEEALQIALSESLHMYQSSREERDLALAIRMSLAAESQGMQPNCSESRTQSHYSVLTRLRL